MSPRVGPLEIPAPKKDPRRDPSDPPHSEFENSEKSTKAQVAEFRTSRFSISLPSAVVLAVVTGFSAALVAWVNKPAPPPAAALTAEQAAALAGCARVSQDVGEIKAFVRWAEPQIGILLVRTDSRAYTPPPRAP